MKIEKLLEVLPEKFVHRLLEKGIEKLNPVQSEAVERGLLEGVNMVISSPTASGKTLIAVLAAAARLFGERGKVVYLVPLRALANEKFEEFKEFFDGMFKVAISTGDYDSADTWLENYDIIILTVEKMDSLMRHGAGWVNEISLVIADEVHLLNEVERGPTLEVVLTKLKALQPQILALSATIKNAEEIALWLNATCIKSDYRPVKLKEGVLLGRKIKFISEEIALHSERANEFALMEDTLKRNKQILVFVSTRKHAENLAERLAELCGNFLKAEERAELAKIARAVKNTLETPTAQCRKLSEVMARGVAFHHAGLVAKQRKIIEDAFRSNWIKVIVATPTLAAGVNLPAYRVLIRDVKRFYPGYGSVFIPVLEYQQMAGRAGRPKYDKEGEAIILARSESAANLLFEKYVLGEPEEIYSKLAVEPVLRMHVLGLIAGGEMESEELYEFIEETFYAYQYGDASRVIDITESVIEDLISWGFVVQVNEKLIATRIGKRVSDLYIDPETAWKFICAMNKFPPRSFGILHLICSAREMQPWLRVKNSEYSEIQAMLAKRVEELMVENRSWFLVDEFLESFKTALLLESWINEAGEDWIYNRFGVTPGELYARIEIADWLLYALAELALLLGKKDARETAKMLRARIKHGVKEELLPLVAIRGVGRKRARKLYNAGIKSARDVKRAPREVLKRILGEKTAEKILESVK